MGAVAVDAGVDIDIHGGGGHVWWIEAGGRLHRRGGGVAMADAVAITVASSGLLVLDRAGRLGTVDELASGAARADLAGARDLAVDDVAGIAYVVVAGAVVARSLTGEETRVIAALDAGAVALSPDRRWLYIADRDEGRVLSLSTRDGAMAASVSLDTATLGAGPTGLAVTAAGLVATCARAVIGINLRHRATTIIHGPETPVPLRAARGIAPARNRRTYWVADEHGLVAVAADGTGVVDEPA